MGEYQEFILGISFFAFTMRISFYHDFLGAPIGRVPGVPTVISFSAFYLENTLLHGLPRSSYWESTRSSYCDILLCILL